MFQVIQIAWQIADGDALGRAGRRTRLDLVRIAIRRQPPPARPVMPPDDSAPVHVRAGRNLRRYQVACQKNTASRTPKQADVGYPIIPPHPYGRCRECGIAAWSDTRPTSPCHPPASRRAVRAWPPHGRYPIPARPDQAEEDARSPARLQMLAGHVRQPHVQANRDQPSRSCAALTIPHIQYARRTDAGGADA